MSSQDFAPTTPAAAWRALRDGNARFVAGTMRHPAQDADRRAAVRAGQHPFAVLVGCSDSRVAAEIVFDRGLGDLFVVRTAGHVTDSTVLGSIEYGVTVLGTPLVVVLGHQACGAVAATRELLAGGPEPAGYVRAIVDRVRPHLAAALAATPDADDAVLVAAHVRATTADLLADSTAVRDAVAAGRCAVVGAMYELSEGLVRQVVAHGLDTAEGAADGPDGSM